MNFENLLRYNKFSKTQSVSFFVQSVSIFFKFVHLGLLLYLLCYLYLLLNF